MRQDTKHAPFNTGDHVRYVAAHRHALPTGAGAEKNLVLAAGMEGVILLSTGSFSDQDAKGLSPWRCQVQFPNGYQLDITPANHADFEVVGGAGVPID
jgi:hypothetical protein